MRTGLATVSSESAKLAVTRSRARSSKVYAVIDDKRVELQEEPEALAVIEWHEANRLFAQAGYLGYAHKDGLTVVALDYLGRELQCLILLPDKDRSVDAVAAMLKPAALARWAKLGNETRATLITLHLPRFRIEGTTFPLGSALRQLGVKSAFDEPPGSANVDRIAPRRPNDYLKFSEVFHQTFVALDEERTEAAAATAVSIALAGSRATPPPPIEVRAHRPFLFAIQHRASGACLFLGRITDPR